ncbi:T9SS type A sorting domain-containing protein [Flavobacteriaceae bacterium AH-315-B10]|nr:T9SS type A sorting domain-containing protein [Flavobacteriaceae bacterium AH-315-B10]
MKKLYISLFTLFITAFSFGQVILTENFTYADGSLVGNGAWTNHSGNAGDLLVSSGMVVVQHGTPSEDANLPFTGISGTLFYGLDFSVDDLGAPYTSGGDYEYFAHFKVGGTNNFSARLDIVPPTGGGDYSVGIASDESTADAVWATDLTYGVTYRAIVMYDQVNNQAQLWIDATSSGDTSIMGEDRPDPGDTVNEFALRQSDSSENETVRVDNLMVGQTFGDATLSTKDNQIEGFRFSPNPTSLGYVNIYSRSQTAMKVNVFDIIGKQVINETIRNNRLNVSSLNTGVYIMRVSQDNAFVTKKLVIN